MIFSQVHSKILFPVLGNRESVPDMKVKQEKSDKISPLPTINEDVSSKALNWYDYSWVYLQNK